jgi:hypothetical protein
VREILAFIANRPGDARPRSPFPRGSFIASIRRASSGRRRWAVRSNWAFGPPRATGVAGLIRIALPCSAAETEDAAALACRAPPAQHVARADLEMSLAEQTPTHAAESAVWWIERGAALDTCEGHDVRGQPLVHGVGVQLSGADYRRRGESAHASAIGASVLRVARGASVAALRSDDLRR